VFGPDAVRATVSTHAHAIQAPADLAGAFVAGRVAGALGRIQAWSLAITGCALEITPTDLRVGFDGDEVAGAVDLTRARVVGGEGPHGFAAASAAAGRTLDATIRDLVATCSEAAGARVPARVVASAAVFAWYAALREIRPQLDGRTPAEVLAEQWRASWALGTLVRPLEITEDAGPRTYLARAACCLEYRCDAPQARRYCTSCPMVDPARARERLESGTTSGGRRPFGSEALRSARRAVAS